MADADAATPAEILTFWREAGHDRWYTWDEAFDAEIRRRYLELWRKAANGEFSSWERQNDDRALALVIVFDQFSPQPVSRRCAGLFNRCERTRGGATRH